jgi:transcriptional regulator with XRE-family HTH domain
MEIKQRFGARLRALRAERAISQEKLSELSGLSVDTISNLERAISVPQLDSVEAIRAGCGLPIWELLDFLGRGETPDPERQAAEDALLQASRRLDPSLLAVAVEQVQALVRYAGRCAPVESTTSGWPAAPPPTGNEAGG